MTTKTLLVTLELRIKEDAFGGTEILGNHHGSWTRVYFNVTRQGALDALNSGLIGNAWSDRYDFETVDDIVEEPQS